MTSKSEQLLTASYFPYAFLIESKTYCLAKKLGALAFIAHMRSRNGPRRTLTSNRLISPVIDDVKDICKFGKNSVCAIYNSAKRDSSTNPVMETAHQAKIAAVESLNVAASVLKNTANRVHNSAKPADFFTAPPPSSQYY